MAINLLQWSRNSTCITNDSFPSCSCFCSEVHLHWDGNIKGLLFWQKVLLSAVGWGVIRNLHARKVTHTEGGRTYIWYQWHYQCKMGLRGLHGCCGLVKFYICRFLLIYDLSLLHTYFWRALCAVLAMKENYRPSCMLSFKATGAFGANLRLFSFSELVCLELHSTQPWEKIYRGQSSEAKHRLQ